MNDTPVAAGDSTAPDIDSAIERLRMVDPAEAADEAESVARRLALELDPPDEPATENISTPPDL